jgi:hypothetical protein
VSDVILVFSFPMEGIPCWGWAIPTLMLMVQDNADCDRLTGHPDEQVAKLHNHHA